MTTWAVWSALKKVPRDVWLLVVGVALVVGGYFAVVGYGARQFDKGKQAAAAGVVFDSVSLARAAEVVTIRTQHTDTVTVTVTKVQRRLDTVLIALPDSLRAVPEVADVVHVAERLSVEVTALKEAHTAERAAWTEKAKVDSAAIYALRIIGTAQRDTIVTLQKRPTRKAAALFTVVGALVGAVVAHAR